jgi:hypothetical protein
MSGAAPSSGLNRQPGGSEDDPDEENGFAQWEYAANHSLEAEPLKAMLEERIKTEIQADQGKFRRGDPVFPSRIADWRYIRDKGIN